ncbi:MAG TPA: MATE family efflux transporter [Candidatus Fusicatenibacter intestinigallinarum]|uniref:MATE family efflux transporter n=1 Tax=Candidatus Fusicatenibacter intestinigallinarum TaxID=2838598 RepID=A0A9D2SMK3_9FIRM|nr:MATE family efflux transporter [Candidatus Fusicatenibacter intestinigallinarum]
MKDRHFYRTFFSMYFVLVFQNVISLSVNLADNIMLGAYSEVSLSGVAAVNQIQFIYQQLLTAAGDGMVIFCSQYWGKKQLEPVKKIAATAMHTGLVFAAALFLAVSLFPEQAVGLFTTDQAIIAEGVKYLSLIRFTYLFFAVTTILLATLRSVEIVKIAFYLSVSTLVINCCINYVLIYGKFGAPRLGVTGAAVGTLVARIVECGAALWYVLRKEPNLKMRISDYFRTDRLLRRDYFKTMVPMLIVQGLWGLNTAMQTVILGHMTARAIAANSAASNLFLMVKSMAVGASSAASVLIGKTIGEGDLKKVHLYARRLQKMFVVIGIVSGVFLYFLRIPVLSFYDLAPETREMANRFLIILSVICVTMSYQMPTNNGIIRGGGNAMFVVRMDLISIWCIVIPLSFFMAFVVKASPVVVVCCLNADQVFKCIPAFLEVNYGKWVKKLTRD